MHSARRTAIIEGDKFFTTGKACKRGHLAERYATSGACRECQREASAIQAMELAQARGPKAERLGKAMRREECLEQGGPDTAEEAEAVGLDWYNCPGRVCMEIIPLGGSCAVCAKELLE